MGTGGFQAFYFLPLSYRYGYMNANLLAILA
jgi:hypothetical protein